MTALANPSLAELRTIDLFDELSDAELEPWTQAATIREAAAGERIYHAGDTAVGVTLLLDGRLELLGREGDVEVRQAVQLAPTWIGVVATLLGTPAVGAGRAETEIRYAHIDADTFVDLALTHRPVFTRAMAQMKPMMARMAQRQQQHERMESLGTMAAGLAHELNNPASAAKQAARELTESLEVLSATVGVFVESGVEREEAAHLVALHERALALCKGPSALSSLQAADLEDELSDALAELGVPEPWSVAATFAAAGLDVGYVREVAESAGPVTIPVLRWVGASLSARQLAAELSASTSRMSDLVIAIKKYAYTKPGAIESVDLRDSLEATLTLLKHKLKHTEIDVVRHYDESLAPVAAFGTELDQVWTNLLVNAIDALGDSGTITITTRADGDCAEVDIADDGPGIPAELRRRVFDPFFTTKDVGQGTGLGLDTARRIVNDRHHGSLTVESSTAPPSGTMFRARLPLDAARR